MTVNLSIPAAQYLRMSTLCVRRNARLTDAMGVTTLLVALRPRL